MTYYKHEVTPLAETFDYGESSPQYCPQVANAVVPLNLNSGSTLNNTFDGTYGSSPLEWRKAIKQGNQAGSSFSMTKLYYELGKADFLGSSNYIWSLYKKLETHITGLAPSIYWLNSLVDVSSLSFPEAKATAMAKEKFIRLARRRRTQVQGGVIAGELVKTLRLIRRPLRSFYYALRHFQRDAKKRTRDALRGVRGRNRLVIANRVVAGTWLEYTFGWTPLVNDIDDISRYLANRILHDTPAGAFCVGKGEAEESVDGGVLDRVHSGAKLRYTKVGRKKVTVVYKGLLRDTTQHSGLKWVHRDLGFSLDNWLPTVWELIPYSFLVDYFTNVGDLISAYSFGNGNFSWIMQWIIKEERSELNNPIDWSTAGPASCITSLATGTECARVIKTISRVPYTGSLWPGFRFEIPGLSMKWLNMAALAGSRNRIAR